MSPVRIIIDQLALKGLDPVERKAMVEGLKRELTKVLSNPATRAEWAHSHRTPVLRLGPLPIQPGAAGSRQFGSRVARALGRGLKP